MNKKILQLIIVMLFAMSGVMAQTVQLGHVENAVPGTVTVPLNMNDFTGANGDLGAISLYIQYDSDLLTYTGFSNLNSAFSGINVNYSQPTHELRIIWYGSTAGVTIDGKLLDLNFTYSGGFSTDMAFTDACEINKFNFNPIAATYENGSVSNSPDINTYTGVVGSWPQTAEVGETVSLPILIEGNTGLNPEAYSAVNSITLKIAFDTQKLTYHGVTNNIYGFSVAENNGVLNLQWSSVTPRDFRTFAPLMLLNFTYNGGGIALLEFKPGSMVTSGYFVENTYFINGNVQLTPAVPGTGSLSIADMCATDTTSVKDVPVTYAGDPIANVGALTLNFSYDKTKLTYAGYTANQLTGWLVSHTAGHVTFINTSATGQTINAGSLVTLKLDYYAPGKADIAFEAGTSLLNTGFTYIPLTLNDGYVSLTPEITDQPDAQTVNYGAPATFSIVATNAISYQWQELVSGVWTNVTDGGIYSGATTNTLNISAVTGNMNTYQYKCIVQPCDITSDPATITYNDAVITDQPDPQTVNLGSSASFNLTATGFSGFQWQEYNGSTWTPITDGGIYSGATTNTLTISAVTGTMNNYQYKCIVQPGNVNSDPALLTVTFNVSGVLKYAEDDGGNSIPIPNSTVNLKSTDGTITYGTTTTDTDGNFSFNNVIAGNYKLDASSTIDATYSYDLTDAFIIYLIGGDLTGLRALAADVNEVDGVDMTDAFLVYLSVDNGFIKVTDWIAPDWIFEQPAISVVNANVVQDFYGICSGDVNADFNPHP